MTKVPVKSSKKKPTPQTDKDIKATISKAISSKNLKSLKVKFK